MGNYAIKQRFIWIGWLYAFWLFFPSFTMLLRVMDLFYMLKAQDGQTAHAPGKVGTFMHMRAWEVTVVHHLVGLDITAPMK